MRAANPNPQFIAPKHHGTRPYIIRKCFNYANAEDTELHNWTGWLLLRQSIGRQRSFYDDMKKTMAAMVPAMIHHLNIHTMKIEATVEELTDLCKLSTVSEAGNKSITRGSRFMELLKKANIIDATDIWDKHNECWLPKFITVNPIFFEWIGIDMQEIEAQQARLRRFVKLDYITADELATLTPLEIKKKAKVAHIRHAFNHRKEKIQRKKKASLQKRMTKKSESQQKNEIAQIILSELSHHEKATLSSKELNLMVNQRRKYLRKISEDVDPPPNKH